MQLLGASSMSEGRLAFSLMPDEDEEAPPEKYPTRPETRSEKANEDKEQPQPQREKEDR